MRAFDEMAFGLDGAWVWGTVAELGIEALGNAVHPEEGEDGEGDDNDL